MKRFFAILAAAVALTACLDSDPFLYRYFSMGYVKDDGNLKADDGRTYIFADKPEWNAGERVIAALDATSAVNDSVYNAKMISFAYPLYKQPIVFDSVSTEPDTLGLDEIRIVDAWYSGGCINMSAQIKILEGAGSNIVNMVVDKRGVPSADTLKLVLRHRCNYEVQSTDYLTAYSFYASFPIREHIAAKDSVVLKLSWFWDGKAGSTEGKVEK